MSSIENFYKIKIQEFSFSSNRLIDKTIHLCRGKYFPPTYHSVIWDDRKTIEKWVLDFHLKEVPEDIQEKFAKNIHIQQQIIDIIQWRNEDYWYNCWMIKLETWIWKWNLATQIVDYYKQPTLILVSNKKLQAEMIERFEEFSNIKPAQYWWGKKNIWPITVCTKKSFSKDYELFSHFKVVIIDEMHQGFSDLFRNWLNKWFYWKRIALYWMSWTTYTQELKAEHLEKYFGKVIDLKIWYSIIPKFTFLNFYNTKQYEFEAYHELKEQLIWDEKRYEEQKEWLWQILMKNRYVLVLSDRLEEIERLYDDMYTDYKYEIIKITWQTKIEDDEANLKKASESWKKILIIWSISKVGTWFNFPMLDAIYLISSIKFKAQVIQAIWRILRQCEGKTDVNAYIWNDQILKKQRVEKQKTILAEYWIVKWDIEQIDINLFKPVLWKVVKFPM